MALPITQAVKDLFLNNTLQMISITATPLEGSAITITEADIVQGSFSIDRSSVASSDIEIGNASSAELMMTLNNVSDFVYEGATLSVSVGVDGNTVPMGVFVVDEVKRVKTTTNIIALDKMVAFDKDADKTAFADGLTPSQVLNVCCTQCGVTLGDVTDMVNPNITVNVSAIEDGFTYRDLIIWIGECTATNAFVNESGSLVMKWYNGNAVATLTEENRVASDLQNYPVEITGVKIVDGDTEYISGEEGYVIKIENNPLIVQNSIATRLSAIATRLVGFSYQPWSAETHPMPWIMPCDMIDFVKSGTTHNTIVTNSRFWLNRNTQFAGKGESPMAKGYAQKALTKQQQNVVKGVERRSELGDQQLQNQITEINNHFWWDSSGAHVSTIAGDASLGSNVLLDSDSLDIREGETTIASFGSTTQIGKNNDTHIEIDYHSLKLKDKEGNDYFVVEDLRNEQGIANLTIERECNGLIGSFRIEPPADDTNYVVKLDGTVVTTGIRKYREYVSFSVIPPNDSVITIEYTTSSVDAKRLKFGRTTASGSALSSAFGVGCQASGYASHAEGGATTASGYASHAEGGATTASGEYSHAEGSATTASGDCSHAEGLETTASREYSHAEGSYTTASGDCSHAQNLGTIARGESQTALGKYNMSDTTSAVIIGNGTEDNRSNALTIDWNGNVVASGSITDGDGLTMESGFVYRGRLSANTNLNTVLTMGRYHFATADNITNTPTGVTWGLLEVLRNSDEGGIIIQRITVNNRIYLRQTINMGSEWSEWYAFSPDAIHNTWTAYTAEYLGLTITLKVNNAMPTLVRLKINGTTTGALATASGYVTLATFSDVSMPAGVLGYSILGALGYGQIRLSGGKVDIGYTRRFSDGTTEDIPTGRGVYLDQAFIVG